MPIISMFYGLVISLYFTIKIKLINPRITKVSYESPYKLNLKFTDNTLRQFDMSPYLHYPVYQVLKDESYCRKAKVFNSTVIFDEMVDFCPDTLFLESKLVTEVN